MTTDPDETGFDVRLRMLAKLILDSDLTNHVSPFGRDDVEAAIFGSMQTFSVLKGLAGSPNDLAACEKVGRAHAKLRTTTSPTAA